QIMLFSLGNLANSSARPPARPGLGENKTSARWPGQCLGPLLDQLVGDIKQFLWNAQAERFSGLEIDHEFVLGGSLDGKIAGLGAFEYLIHDGSRAARHLGDVWPVRDQAAILNKFPIFIEGWQTMLRCKRDDRLSRAIE